VRLVEGDGTITNLALALPCAKIWKDPVYNPGGAKVFLLVSIVHAAAEHPGRYDLLSTHFSLENIYIERILVRSLVQNFSFLFFGCPSIGCAEGVPAPQPGNPRYPHQFVVHLQPSSDV